MTRAQEMGFHALAEPIAEAAGRSAMEKSPRNEFYDTGGFERYWREYERTMHRIFGEIFKLGEILQ